MRLAFFCPSAWRAEMCAYDSLFKGRWSKWHVLNDELRSHE
jgi:hypothetical protein